jgi:transmembrane sensor
MTGTWDATAGLRRSSATNLPISREFWRTFRRTALAAAATLAICALLAVSALSWIRPGALKPQALATALGERRSLLLPDGSHLILNTQSQVTVSFTAQARHVTLVQGQARFEVAHHPGRPFVVRAGGQQIIAVGTAFDVRWTDERLSVVLLKGQVAVVPVGELPLATAASAVTLEPGERLQFEGRGRAVRSRAQIEREEAWVGGRVVFDATPLAAAIAEINRYAPRRLVLGDPELANLRISGTFSVDDSAAFARAVADVFALEIASANGMIVLRRSVTPQVRSLHDL